MAIKDVRIYKKGDKLTVKQEKWINEYIKCNDYTTASRNAGYKGSDDNLKAMGYQNSIKFKELLEEKRRELSDSLNKSTIAELDDIFEFWTKTLKDNDEYMKNRLKASELLAKAKGAFVEKVEVKEVESEWFK